MFQKLEEGLNLSSDIKKLKVTQIKLLKIKTTKLRLKIYWRGLLID